MTEQTRYGYMGKILRVDLTLGSIREEPLEEALVQMYLGGTGFGTEYLYREVPPGVAWDSPDNRIIMATGPLAGTTVPGTGSFSLVTKGPLSNLAVSTQANGFWGAYLKFAGYDAVILQGRSPKWVYLSIGEGTAELRDASAIMGTDTWQMEDAVRQELGVTQGLSVYGIGPAGENLVRFAIVAGDKGHICSKNGCGCVMGSKRLKAIAIPRFKRTVSVHDRGLLSEKTKALSKVCRENRGGLIYNWGTGGLVTPHYEEGIVPVRNYTTNLYPEHTQMDSHYLRERFEHRKKACWACSLAHNRFMKVTDGPYAGYEGEEPDLESIAMWGPLIGNTDPGSMVMLSNVIDKLGLDSNEAGWTVAWAMDCYDRGIFTQEDMDGLDMRWGNVEGVRTLLEKISCREGIGDLLADGVKLASQKIGGEAAKMAVYVLKGTTPRGHDHRGSWSEMLETCVSATGTIQSGARLIQLTAFGLPPISNPFSPWEVAGANAKIDGWFIFLDCLGICRFLAVNPALTMDCFNAVTGRDFALSDAMTVGRRVINQLRVFNFRHGLDPALEAPSFRYGSTPQNGPAEGKSVQPYFEWMKSFYFELMGWDPKTGKPLPHTLQSLGLEKLIGDLE
jgi:aldehyde:ferredoxin oxidoreductase